LGDNEDRSIAVECSFFTGKKIKQMAAGYNFSVVLLQNGEIYTFGDNCYGNLVCCTFCVVVELTIVLLLMNRV
jgi:alpha-tubulin suppressor-like RCC1 family protein